MKAVEEVLTLVLEKTRNGQIEWQLDTENNNPNILAKYIASFFGAQLLVGKSVIEQAPYFFSVTFREGATGNLFPSEMENPYRLQALYDCAAKPGNDACLEFIAHNALEPQKVIIRKTVQKQPKRRSLKERILNLRSLGISKFTKGL